MLWENAILITPVLVAADIRIAVRNIAESRLSLANLLTVFITTIPTI